MTNLACDGSPRCVVDFADRGPPRLFEHPLVSDLAWTSQQVPGLLDRAEQCSRQGLWVVVLVGYEAAAAFGLPVCAGPPAGQPLAWFGAFEQARPFLYADSRDWVPARPPRPVIRKKHYRRCLHRIHHLIEEGETYQVNFTLPHRLARVLRPCLFPALQIRGRFPYAAWLTLPLPHGPTLQVASLSPELFLQRQGGRLISGPIKGTRGRGRDLVQELARRTALQQSAKERAEHVMIVDMVRNDLGRVAAIGSVRVPRLMETRALATILHLETRVEAEVEPDVSLSRLFAALFPAASVTGAPKHHTMAIIRELEARPRGIYTGAIGLLEPGGDFTFNVAIRTVTWIGRQRGFLGLGGGIVADSRWPREWRELREKSAFLRQTPPPFHLFETMAWLPDQGWQALAAHLDRLQASAQALGMVFSREQAAQCLHHGPTRPDEPRVVRLDLSPDGAISLTERAWPQDPPALRVRLASLPLDRLDPLSRHKTSRRQHLDQALARARAAGYDEVLFLNGDGMMAEGAIRSLLVQIQGRWLAPPVTTGILPGLWRQQEILQRQALEQEIPLAWLPRIEAMRMGNSVRGGRPVEQLDDDQGRRIWPVTETRP